MPARSATLLASTLLAPAALLLWSSAATAQDRTTADYALETLPGPGAEEGDWQGAWDGGWVDGEWIDGETWRGIWQGTYTDPEGRSVEGRYRGTFIGESEFLGEDGRYLVNAADTGWREDAAGADGWSRHSGGARRSPVGGPALGYSLAEREAWLADCRALYLGDAYYTGEQRERGGNGGVIGGIFGAVAGGIAGNRIADGERLAGTLIGAGVGGLAGLAIGSLFGGGGERDEERRDALLRQEATIANYCESYLQRYESGRYGGAYGYALQAQPVMLVQMVPAPGRRSSGECTECREMIRDEWVDEPARPARRATPRRQAQPAQGTKLVPAK